MDVEGNQEMSSSKRERVTIFVRVRMEEVVVVRFQGNKFLREGVVQGWWQN